MLTLVLMLGLWCSVLLLVLRLLKRERRNRRNRRSVISELAAGPHPPGSNAALAILLYLCVGVGVAI